VTLKQYADDSKFPAQNPTSGTPAPQRSHMVQPGETLDRIAWQHYGDSTRWRAIAAANRIRDPFSLRAGTMLDIPTVDT
jgi:nucleoid-associated protein YgaU